jgi:hypothetical protein
MVRVMVPQKLSSDGALKVLGYGECPTLGILKGRFVNLGDASESLTKACDEAAKQAGVSFKRLRVTLDDPFLDAVQVEGSISLENGVESFSVKHVQEARRRALYSVKPTDKHLIFQGLAGFRIDKKKYDADPVGVVGKELTIILQLLFSESRQVQNLTNLFERGGYQAQGFFPSALSAVHGTLTQDCMQEQNVLVLARPHVCHFVQFGHQSIRHYSSVLIEGQYGDLEIQTISSHLKDCIGDSHPTVFFTGEGSEEDTLAARLGEIMDCPIHCASCRTLNKKFQPGRYAVLIGMLYLQNQDFSFDRLQQSFQSLVSETRLRAQSLLHDYF